MVLMRSSKRFGVRRRERILSFDTCRIAMFRLVEVPRLAQVPTWLSEDQSCNLRFKLMNFSSTNQCRWSSHVLFVHSVRAASGGNGFL